MKQSLRKKFILFAMSAVTVLLVVLVGAINGFSWIILDHQSGTILQMLAGERSQPPKQEFHAPQPLAPPGRMDMLQSARFFTVRTDSQGEVLEIDLDRMASVSEAQAAAYAGQITGTTGKIDHYKYAVRQLDEGYLLVFVDTSGQLWVSMMMFCISSAIALVCWLAMLLFVILLSGRVVRPILAGMEKQKQFITNAGHELKTPLAIIQSNNDASALLCGETKYSKNIRLQTQRLNALMTNLLTLARLDEGVRLPTESLDLAEMMRGMLAAYEDAIAQKHIALSISIPPHLQLQAHRESLAQMISILLDNAVKYTPEGGAMRIVLAEKDRAVEVLEENSCDPPCGGDPERLFERFYRGDDARTQDHAASGYGIGLSAARAIVEMFGGTLTASYPEPGKIRFTARFCA